MTLSEVNDKNDDSHLDLEINYFKILINISITWVRVKFSSSLNNYLTLDIMTPYIVTLNLHSSSLRSTEWFLDHISLILLKDCQGRRPRWIRRLFLLKKKSFPWLKRKNPPSIHRVSVLVTMLSIPRNFWRSLNLFSFCNNVKEKKKLFSDVFFEVTRNRN